MISFLLLTGLTVTVYGGVCPSYPYIRDFDFSRYTGLWYQQDKQQTGWATPGRCWRSLYVRDATTGQYRMKILYENTITGNSGIYESAITLQGPSKPSVIEYSIPYTFMQDSFQVLATDYVTYSIEYQCDENGIMAKSENVFLLTRDKTPSSAVLQRAYAIMHRYSLDIRKLERVDQTCGGLKIDGVVKPTEMMRADLIDRQFGEKSDEYDYYEDPLLQNPTNLVSRMGSSNVFYRHKPASRSLIGWLRDETQRRSADGLSTSIDSKERFKLSQSLATRLWHILHTPLR